MKKERKLSCANEVAQQLHQWIVADVRSCNTAGVANAIYDLARAYGLTTRRVRAIYHNQVKAPLAWEYLQVQRKRAERLAAMNAEASEIREQLKELEGRCSNVSGQTRPFF